MDRFQPHAEYSEDAGCLYVYLSEGTIARTKCLDDLRNVDYTADGEVVGVEFIDVSVGIDFQNVPFAHLIQELITAGGFEFKVLAS